MSEATAFTLSPTHISSFIVHCLPAQLDYVKTTVDQFYDAEVSMTDKKGKLVVLLESQNERNIMDTIANIEAIPGVITTTMVYHQID